MKKPKKLTDKDYWTYPLGQGSKARENFHILVKEHNNLVEVVNVLIAYHPEQKAIEFLLREE